MRVQMCHDSKTINLMSIENNFKNCMYTYSPLLKQSVHTCPAAILSRPVVCLKVY